MNIDQQLFYKINSSATHPWVDKGMVVLSSWNFWWPGVVILAMIWVMFGGFRARVAFLCIVMTVALTDGVVVHAVKKAVHRPRPNQVVPGARSLAFQSKHPVWLAIQYPLREKRVPASSRALVTSVTPATLVTPVLPTFPASPVLGIRGNSFPSSHAANNFAVATLLVLFYGWRGVWAFLPALGVAYSRVYVGAHYPSDVLSGAAMGTGMAFGMVSVFKSCWKRWGACWFPALYQRYPVW